MGKLNKLILLFFCFFVFLTVGTSALTFENGESIDLIFPCTHNGSICAASTTCNISVIYPNGSKMVENQQASYVGSGLANYTLPDSSTNGFYVTPISCAFAEGTSERGNADFWITPNGETPDIAKSVIYLGLILLILVLFIVDIVALFNIDNFGWRIGLMSMAYILMNGFLLVSWTLADMFLTSVPYIVSIFKVLYIATTAGYFPFFLAMFVYVFVSIANEKNIKTLVGRGYSEDNARSYVGRRRRR